MRRAPLALALLVLVAGCGGSSGDDGVASLEEVTSTSTTQRGLSEAATEAALLDFAGCMRDAGIEIPDPVIGPDGFPELSGPLDLESLDLEAAVDALRSCQSHLEGVALGFEVEDQAAFLDTLVEFADCMRDQGLDFADPDLTQDFGPDMFADLDLADPDVVAALTTCRDLLGLDDGTAP